MTLPRFYFPDNLACGMKTALPTQAAHHAAKVLRLSIGDEITLFDGSGGEYAALINDLGKHGVTVQIGAHRAAERESPLCVTLAQAISSGDKMDLTLQKATELGIARIQPLESGRSVVRLSGERADKRVAHWQGVVISACEQCGRNQIPEVAPICRFHDWLAAEEKSHLRLMLSPGAPKHLRDLPRPERPITLLVGPEGGLAPAEIASAQHAGYTPIRLGARILRTETAALAALAAMQVLWGDF